MTAWISVKKRLPEMGGDYLVSAGSEIWMSLWSVFRQEWYETWKDEKIAPTHWMPLPPEPDSEGG